MQEQLSEILFYIKGTLKYKWVIIIAAWLISIAGWLYVSSMPDEYQSKAIVQVDSNSALQPLLRGLTVRSDNRGLIAIMQQLMFTRPRLERVAQLANLDMDTLTELKKLDLIDELKKGIKIVGVGNDLFSISYNGAESKESQDIVHAVLTVFSEQAQQRGIDDSGSAQQFIEEQIREYEMRLTNAEKARENFERVNSGLLPSQGGGGIDSLSTIKLQLEAADMSLSEVNSQVRVLHGQINDAKEMEGESNDEWGLGDMGEGAQASTPEDAQIADLQQRISELLIRYTAQHPDVVSIKIQIEELEKRRLESLANMPENDPDTPLANPYTQALQMQLNQLETERASIKSRINILNNRMADIQQGMDARLRIATEMKNLDRDYSVIKSNYMNLIASRETAALTEKAGRSQGILKFKIVEAPTAPLEATGPNRTLFDTAILAMGLAIGGGFAFLIYFIRPTFMSTLQLRNVTGLPVLGSVAVQIKQGEKSVKHKQVLFWFMFISLLLAYIIVISIV